MSRRLFRAKLDQPSAADEVCRRLSRKWDAALHQNACAPPSKSSCCAAANRGTSRHIAINCEPQGTSTMNSFEAMGQAQLLAAEGQRQIARQVAAAIGRLLARLLDGVARHLPESKSTPW
jgi:hypothetical protein